MFKKYQVEIIVTLVLIALIGAAGYSLIQKSREASSRRPCPHHLRQIGQALLLYANDNQGAMPQTIEELVGNSEKRFLPAKCLVCPEDSRSAASASNDADLQKQLATGKHTSYAYLGAGKILRNLSGWDVVCYEPLSMHEEGGNVLFGDGHVEFILARAYAAVQSGHLPNPSTQPTSEPR